MLVTCVCITRNRRAWLPKAIACFESQTYADRRLLIVSDGEDVSDLIPQDSSKDPRITHCPQLSRHATIGAKRNAANAIAETELIAHFDDDDFYGPHHLANRIARLEETGKAVAGYRQAIFADTTSQRRWRYDGMPNFAFGASLVYRADWWKAHPFAAVQIGEEHGFVGTAVKAGRFVADNAGEHFIASIHPQNTSKRHTSGSPWKELR